MDDREHSVQYFLDHVNSFLEDKNVQNVPYITEYAKLLF